MTLELVVCGFQTGVDQAGARAAQACNIPTTGWLPHGWLTEDGPRPDFEALYGAKEHPSPQYPPRTYANAKLGDLTLWLGDSDSRGFACTQKACVSQGRPFLVVDSGTRPSDVAEWIRTAGARSVNIAGPRESRAPGIGERAELFLTAVFRRLTSNQTQQEQP